VDAPRLRLELILGHCERHALLHMAPKLFDHWTTWAGLVIRLERTPLVRTFVDYRPVFWSQRKWTSWIQ